MENIKHIVYLMLENRSLANVLGGLYRDDTPLHFIPSANTAPFDGLPLDFSNPDKHGKKIPVSPITPDEGQTIPGVDPHEDFEHVRKQISNSMQGFYEDFATTGTRHPEQIMKFFTPKSLPVINALATSFAVSDAYFSSIPTQTNCNRAFSLTGNSIGNYHDFGSKRTAMVDNYWEKNPFGDLGDPYTFTGRTIWNVLSKHGFDTKKDWMIFYDQTWPGVFPYYGNYCFTQDLLWPTMKDHSGHFQPMSHFYDLLGSPDLPAFSFLEPSWYEKVQNGSDYHPPANLTGGEHFLHHLYHKLQGSTHWANTLLIINFDEHGGTLDHVEPPSDGDSQGHKIKSPWADKDDGTEPPDDYDIKFSYEKLGVRVPLILVSPLIEDKTVIRAPGNTPFDHTSVLATVLEHFGIDRSRWKLGSRTAHAPTFGDVVTLPPSKARTDVQIPKPLSTKSASAAEDPPGELQWMLVHRMLSRAIRDNGYDVEHFNRQYEKHFKAITSIRKLNEKTEILLRSAHEHKAAGAGSGFWGRIVRFLKRLFGMGS